MNKSSSSINPPKNGADTIHDVSTQTSIGHQNEWTVEQITELTDVLAIEDKLREIKSGTSLARPTCDAIQNDLEPTGKKLNLELPCPKCDDGDCFWKCEKCLDPLIYYLDEFFYCKCGKVPINSFEFRCKNTRKHGQRFMKFEPEKLKEHLKTLSSFKQRVILVLGQTGVGKSTWINSIAHYLTYESLEAALNGEPVNLVPSSFTMNNKQKQKIRVIVGEESASESFAAGESATREPKVYSFDYKGDKLVFIDTPGIGDNRGFEQDKANFSRILDYVSTWNELHGVCILLKPNEARLTPSMLYCLNKLFSHLHCSAAENFVFCLTNTQGTFYEPGETSNALEKFLDDLKETRGISIELNEKTIFCVDNCAFRYLCARRQGVQFDEKVHAINVEAWEKSWSETYRLINCISNNKPHSVATTMSLNEARRIIMSLAKPLAVITKEIQLNIAAIDHQKDMVRALTGDEKDFRSRLKVFRHYVVPKELDYPRTVCISQGCVEVKVDRHGTNHRTFNKHCHEHCYLEGVTVATHPNEALLKCWAMNGTNNCRVCGCAWNMHMHVNWEHTEENVEVTDEAVKRELKTVEDKKIAKMQIISQCVEMVAAYNSEQKTVNEIAARFAAFVKANAIVFYNDAIEEYIKVEIDNAQAEAAVTNDRTKVESLQKALAEYLAEKSTVQSHLDQAGPSDEKLSVSLQDIGEDLKMLYSLPMTGKNIEKMLNLELGGQQKHLSLQQVDFATYDRRRLYDEKIQDEVACLTSACESEYVSALSMTANDGDRPSEDNKKPSGKTKRSVFRRIRRVFTGKDKSAK